MSAVFGATANITLEQCTPFARFQVFACLPLTLAISLLLTLRVSALWGNNKFILGLLGTLIVIMTCVNGYAMSLFGAPQFAGGRGPCFAGPRPGVSRIVVSLWLTPFLFDVISTILLVVGVYAVKRQGAVAGSGILHRLLHDGLIYFMLLSAANLINVGFYFGARSELRSINSGMAYTVGSIVSSRLILSLREQAHKESIVNRAVVGYGDAQISRKFSKGSISSAMHLPAQRNLRGSINELVHTRHADQATAPTEIVHLHNIDNKRASPESSDDNQNLSGVHVLKEMCTNIDEEKAQSLRFHDRSFRP
ncbi:MAG: hypothetical protein CYPHOPRED_000342 [Cyphobasidiales sp. Tagirdzhanova-0007]|nr:MAG: hypothetical protein CYPHOPRED_000342 [Cyphobasidiales sp. Tagirdzhanova-0007]